MLKPIINDNLGLLEQVDSLLVQLDNEALAQPLCVILGSSVGMHFRHLLEFYECLLLGLEAGVVAYDRRKRNLLIQTDVLVARLTVRQCIDKLQSLHSDKRLMVESQLHHSNDPFLQSSSLKRELVFVADHAVHHLALIRVGLQATIPQVQVAPEVGIATSTLKHLACAH